MQSDIEFLNYASRPVKLYWLDYEGARELYGTLPPGEGQAFETYENHAWLVAEESGHCVAVFVSGDRPGRAVIQG